MDPWAWWYSPVICFGGKTYRRHIMQRSSRAWLLSHTSLGFSVMYSLAGPCVWWCIHCPSGVGAGWQFYHFIFTSINELVYCGRQHMKFIHLFSHAPSYLYTDSPTSQCECAPSVAGPWHHITVTHPFKGLYLEIWMEIIGFCHTQRLLFMSDELVFSLQLRAADVGWLLHLCYLSSNLCSTSTEYWDVFVSVIITCTCGCWGTCRHTMDQ